MTQRMTQRQFWRRRDFLQRMGVASAGVAASATFSRRAWGLHSPHNTRVATRGSIIDPAIVIDGSDVRTLALRALDAARAAGATYADVRLTRQLNQLYIGGGWQGGLPFRTEGEQLGVGVRALVDGIWGFAASPYWELDDVVQLAREAARQAKTNAQASGSAGAREWAPIPVASGSWATPIKVDPFVLPIEEKSDLLEAWTIQARRYRIGNYCDLKAEFTREERAVATTDGAYFTQTLYQSSGAFTFYRQTIYGEQRFGTANVRGTGLTAAGWELFTEANIPGQLPTLHDESNPDRPVPPVKTGDIGQYDVVCDATTMAALVSATIGTAAQVDRALGYEANAGGTSYLGPDPLALLGSYQAASPVVTITANRSMPRGLATVKWDDEGITPDDFTLVKDGVLVDYQTTREQAAWLAPWYQKQGKPVRSHGCASASSALAITMQHMPNLVLEPGLTNISFDDLVADTRKGLAIIGGQVTTDFQERTGTIGTINGVGMVREITNGRLGPVLTGLQALFNTTQFWKNIRAVGGASSVEQMSSGDSKGEPAQSTKYSVRAVPAKIVNVDFVDPRRRA